MVIRINTKRRLGSHFAKKVLVLLLFSIFCWEGNVAFAQFKFLKNNVPPATANRPSVSNSQSAPPKGYSQYGAAVQNKEGQQNRSVAKNAHIQKQAEPQSYPLGNRSERLQEATNSPVAMKEALRTIPWNRLSNSAQEKIKSVLSEKPLYRRLPQQSAYCEPNMYDFLLDHPDVVVAMWEKLGVTQISLKEYGRPGVYQLKESVGSVGIIEVLYKTRNYCIVYSKGSYSGPFLPRAVDGETILILQNIFEQDEDGDPYVVAQLDAFVNVKNFGVDMFAKLFAPMLGRIADGNFEQTIAFIGNVSEAAQSNPEVIKRLALRLESIRKETRDELIQTAYKTAQLAIDRSDDELKNNPYGRHLLERQTVQTESQRQEFDQERVTYLQNLYRIQQLQKQQQAQREVLLKKQQRRDFTPETESESELVQRVAEAGNADYENQNDLHRNVLPPTVKQPTVLQKPRNLALTENPAAKKPFTIDDMNPENDFSGSLEIVDSDMPLNSPMKSNPFPMPIVQKPKASQGPMPVNLDLDLGLNVDLDIDSRPKKVEKDEESVEQSTLILDLSLDTPLVNPPQAKAASEPPKEKSKPVENKTGVVFSKPSLSR